LFVLTAEPGDSIELKGEDEEEDEEEENDIG
jgi:hypothetical protein